MFKAKRLAKFLLREILDICKVFRSLDVEEKAEFAKIVSFGLFVNGTYGTLHGNLYDLPVVFVSSYAIMKAIQVIKKEKK